MLFKISERMKKEKKKFLIDKIFFLVESCYLT